MSEIPKPEDMRERLTDYVYALNKAYLTHIELLAPAERASMPLASQTRITVAVAAARDLHIVATSDALPAPRGPEVENTDEYAGVSWSVRFFDASILPELGLVETTGDDGSASSPVAVRRVLGVADVIYHLSVSIGGGLTAHHAQHAGVALANQHAAAIRDGQAIRHAYPGREHLVDEFVIAERLNLVHSARLLAGEISQGRVGGSPARQGIGPRAGQEIPALRKALLADTSQPDVDTSQPEAKSSDV